MNFFAAKMRNVVSIELNRVSLKQKNPDPVHTGTGAFIYLVLN